MNHKIGELSDVNKILLQASLDRHGKWETELLNLFRTAGIALAILVGFVLSHPDAPHSIPKRDAHLALLGIGFMLIGFGVFGWYAIGRYKAAASALNRMLVTTGSEIVQEDHEIKRIVEMAVIPALCFGFGCLVVIGVPEALR
jgi:hypothetical protein